MLRQQDAPAVLLNGSQRGGSPAWVRACVGARLCVAGKQDTCCSRGQAASHPPADREDPPSRQFSQGTALLISFPAFE